MYTAVNADELKIGSKVIIAKNIHAIKDLINIDTTYCVLTNILSEDYQDRFVGKFIKPCIGSAMHNTGTLAYLISEPEEKKLKWTDLKIGDIIRNKKTSRVTMVTAIDPNPTSQSELHIYGYGWIYDYQLENDWEIVNHSPINYAGNLTREIYEEDEEQ